MANWWIATSATGDGSGDSYANSQEGTTANIQAALDQLTAGNTLTMEEGTYTLNAILDIDQNSGTKGTEINWIGVNDSGVEDNSRFILDADSTAANCIKINGPDSWIFKHFECINATSNGLVDATGVMSDSTFINISVSSNGASGILGANLLRECTFSNCNFNNNTTHGHHNCQATFMYCQMLGNGTDGGLGSYSYLHCLIHDNGGAGVNGTSTQDIIGCIIDGNGSDGISPPSDGAPIINNRLTNNTGWGVRVTNYSYIDNNGLYNNTGGTISGGVAGTNVNLTADGYEDRGNDDFSLETDDEGIGVSRPIGLLSESTNIGYFTEGIPPTYGGAATPVFAGITVFEMLSDGVFWVDWAAGTGTIDYYDIFIRDGSASVFSAAYNVGSVRGTLTSTYVMMEADNDTLLQAGSTYYCGVRARNSGGSDSNTATLSNPVIQKGTLLRLPINVQAH